MGHYFAVEMFKPVIISPYVDASGNIQVTCLQKLINHLSSKFKYFL